VDAGEVVAAETAAAIEPDKIGVDSLRDYVSGLSPAEIEKLKAAEVTTAGRLLDAGATPAGRAALAAKTGIEPDRLLEYLNTLDLQRIKGVGVAYSWLLKRTGVDTVRELATRNPGNLTRALASTNATMGLVERLPVESEVADWVAQAKTLPPKLTY
jgi:predicted flap endonuclease-1-like 5' DNA nuclease